MIDNNELVEVLLHQRDNHVGDSVYKLIQCDFSYNSNHMEGSRLSVEQTQMVFDRKTISGEGIYLDDIFEAANHFSAFDYILDHYRDPLGEDMFFCLHRSLKAGTAQEKDPLYSVGGYKRYENVVGAYGSSTTPPEKVAEEIGALIRGYESKDSIGFEDVLDFHVTFEQIHPFSDGNGRIGRLLMFKECLRNDIIPFIISDDLHDFYIRGLQKYYNEKGWLRDTCLTAQDRFAAKYLPLAESYLVALRDVIKDASRCGSVESKERGVDEGKEEL